LWPRASIKYQFDIVNELHWNIPLSVL
jgi:hypothetical protein